MSEAIDPAAEDAWHLSPGRGSHGAPSAAMTAMFGRFGERIPQMIEWHCHQVRLRTGTEPSASDIDKLIALIETARRTGGTPYQCVKTNRARHRLMRLYDRTRGARKEPLPERECAWCTLPFTPSNIAHHYCSGTCKVGQHTFWKRERDRYARAGVPFEVTPGVLRRLERSRYRRRAKLLTQRHGKKT